MLLAITESSENYVLYLQVYLINSYNKNIGYNPTKNKLFIFPIEYGILKNKKLVILTKESMRVLKNEKKFEDFSSSVKSEKNNIQTRILTNEYYLKIKNKIKFYETKNKYKAENVLKFVSNKKEELFYFNGVLRVKFTPDILVKRNVNVVYKNLIKYNENGFKYHVKVQDLDYYLFFLNNKGNFFGRT